MLPLLSILLGITQPPYPTISDTWVYHQWDNPGPEYVQELQFGRGNDYVLSPARTWINIESTSGEKVGQLAIIQENGLICRRVKYYKEGSKTIHYLYLGCFYQTGYQSQEENSKSKYILPSNIDNREKENISSNDSNVLGVTTEKPPPICHISLLHKSKFEVTDWNCDLGIQVSSISNSKYSNTYSVIINGIYKESVLASIDIYKCESFNILKPQTWLKCNKQIEKSLKKELTIKYTAKLSPTDSNDIENYIFNRTDFLLKYTTSKDLSKKSTDITFNIYSQFKDEYWIDIFKDLKLSIKIPSPKEEDYENRPFSFPIDKLIGVTQWHGCTSYQCPHKGIDLGANLNNVLSIADGKVIAVGWDSYNGECFQGGNYIVIQHTNGMYSAYFHLDHYLVKKNDVIKKGQKIAVSGNTGKWNCQSLGYHLHFEVRKGQKQDTHVDPVPYIAVDWNLINTIGKEIYPKRLTGDNPHPNF